MPEYEERPVPPLVIGRALVRERDAAEMEEVAVKVEARTSPPVNTPEPETEKDRYGEVEPIPIFPER